MIATALGVALLVWSYSLTCTTVYGVARAAWQRRKQLRNPAPEGTRALVIRPCAGLEPDLARALVSLGDARGTTTIACRFAVGSGSDPAAAVAEDAAKVLRSKGIDARVVITRADAPNHKAAQLAAAVEREEAPFDVVVVADSDVDLAGFELDSLTAPLLASPSAGAVWAPPVEVGKIASSGDRASHALLSGSLHAFTLLGALDGRGLVGKLFAARADAIAEIGGFGALSRVLGEDMELARRLLARGRTISVAPVVARSLKTGRTWTSAVERYARWLTVIRAQRPHLLASYPLMFVAAPVVVMLGLLLAPFAGALAFAAIGFALGSRLLAAIAARVLAGAGAHPLASIADAVFADALLATAFVRAVLTRTLTWRGRTLTIDQHGEIEGRA
ncbi:MAG: glycosyltransferase [Polyangiaceae bacterium]